MEGLSIYEIMQKSYYKRYIWKIEKEYDENLQHRDRKDKCFQQFLEYTWKVKKN